MFHYVTNDIFFNMLINSFIAYILMPGFQPSQHDIQLIPKASPWAEIYRPSRPWNHIMSFSSFCPIINWVESQHDKVYSITMQITHYSLLITCLSTINCQLSIINCLPYEIRMHTPYIQSNNRSHLRSSWQWCYWYCYRQFAPMELNALSDC